MEASVRAKLDEMESELAKLRALLTDPVALSLLLYQLLTAASPN